MDAKKSRKRQPEPIALRVALSGDLSAQRRVLVAATAGDAARLASKGNHVGDLIFARITKPRNPGFHRLAHRIGQLVVENVEGFGHMEAHAALKRLQIESGAGCEILSVEISSVWAEVLAWIGENIGRPVAEMLRLATDAMGLKGKLIPIHVPKSLSYDSMDEGAFKDAVKSICKYLSIRYWPAMSPEDIELMAETTQGLIE